MIRLVLIILFLQFISGCSLFNRVGVRSMTGVLQSASGEMETEYNWDVFQESVIANIKLMEGMLFVDPANEDLLHLLVKGHGAYGFGIYDSLNLYDKLAENDKTVNKNRAIYHYERATSYGLRFLKRYDITYDVLLKSISNEIQLKKLLNDNLPTGENDYDLIFFLAQSWGSIINLNIANPRYVSQLPIVKAFFDWVCDAKPNIYSGSCDVFYGTFYSVRPKMLGGDPPKGKKYFLRAILNNPKNILARVSYLQFFVVPQMDEKGYKKEKRRIMKDITKWKKYVKSNQKNKFKDTDRWPSKLNFFNTIAEKRLMAFKKYQADLF